MQDYAFKKPVSLGGVRDALSKVGYGNVTIQQAGFAGTEFIIRAPQNSEKAIGEALNQSFADNAPEVRRIESVGPLVGRELKEKAVWAFIISLLFIWGYVVVRFDVRYAFGAILALFHDGLVAVAAVALTGRELSITVLAAVLTILGYSINDTIVIFDRIRERRRLGFKETFAEAINNSVNIMMSRTILTSLTVIVVVVCLFIWGGDVINDFAFTMLVGLISGVYSTVYIAAPVLVDWPGSKKKS
jgi:preprotein translocase SecF subunit